MLSMKRSSMSFEDILVSWSVCCINYSNLIRSRRTASAELSRQHGLRIVSSPLATIVTPVSLPVKRRPSNEYAYVCADHPETFVKYRMSCSISSLVVASQNAAYRNKCCDRHHRPIPPDLAHARTLLGDSSQEGNLQIQAVEVIRLG